MQKAFDLIVERLEEIMQPKPNDFAEYVGGYLDYEKTIEIVNQVAEQFGNSEQVNDGWIPCSERLPSEDGFYNVTVKFWHLNKPTVMSSHFECGKWTCVALDAEDVVLAWQPLPTAYVKGE